MKTLKRGIGRFVRVFLPKFFNLFVVATLILQPVGTAGVWGIALAQSTEPIVADVLVEKSALIVDEKVVPKEEEPVPTPEPVKEESAPAPAEEPALVEEPASQVDSPATISDTPDDVLVNIPSDETTPVLDTVPVSDVPSDIDTSADTAPTETPAVAPVPAETSAATPTETLSDTTVTPVVSTETPASTDIPAETIPVISTETIPVVPVQEALSTPAEPVDETVCLSASVEGDSDTNWTIDEEKGVAETDAPVQLGVRYVYPLDKEVTVTFTCLPKDESKRAPLKIERIKASDINLPDGTVAVSEYAYDITTDGMENGTFKYDLTLPKVEGSGDTDVSYVEKSANEAKEVELSENDLKNINEKDVENKTGFVEASNLDHFTIFLVTWNFPNNPDNDIADGGTPANLAKTITAIGTDTPTYNTAGATTNSARATGWDSGSGVKYWQVKFSSAGYSSLKLFSKQRSSSTGPKDFKIQYKIDAGGSWTDVTSGTVTVADNFTTGVVSGLSLPSATDNKSSVYLRWIMTSDTAVGGGAVGNTGASNLDDIVIQGALTLISPECANDSDGANDEPGQKDLTRLCRDQAQNDPLNLTWNWDIISLGGSNTADACALFDIDQIGNAGYGFADYALCVTWEDGAQQVSTSPTLYTCNDTRTDRCAGASAALISNGSSCGVDVLSTDPFSAGNSYPQDAVASCTISLNDVGGVSQANLLDVCSYPSDQPNSDPSDCILISADEGNLEVVKNVVPDDVTTNWDIAVTGPSTFNDTLQGDDSTGIRKVDSGSGYTITETAGTNTSLSNYTSAYSCTKNGSAYLSGSGTTISGVSISDGDLVICAFTNTLSSGTVIVHKDVQGPNGGAVTDTSQNFSVQLDGGNTQSITDNGTVTYNNVSAGAHTITESVIPTGYSLYSITPDSDSGTAGAQISVTAGQTTDVYIVNRQQATTLTLVKEVVNNNGGNAVVANFPLFYDGNQVTSGAVTAVAPDTYTLSETNLSGYTPSAWVCTGTGTQNESDITLTLGQSAICTITNDDTAPTITLIKSVDNGDGGDAGVNDFGLTIGNTSVNSGQTLTVNSNTDYALNEAGLEGYEFVSITGEGCPQNLGDVVNLNEGEDITCTITNDDTAPTITLSKEVLNGEAGVNVFGLTIGGNPTNSGVTTPVMANEDIALDEVGLSVYSFVEITGDEGCPSELGDTVNLSVGENLSCTIVNARDTGDLVIHKIIDIDGNIGTTDDQSDGDGWYFAIEPNGEDQSSFPTDSTNSEGILSYSDVKTGSYDIAETIQDGYDLVSASCGLENGNLDESILYSVNVAKDETTTCTFYNTPNGALHGFKWNDENGNGEVSEGEERLAGWTINLYKSDGDNGYDLIDSMVTSDDQQEFGWYWFDHLFPGEYKICEVLQAGWEQTFPTQGACHFVTLPNNNPQTDQTENSVFAPEYDFGNQFIPPVLQISKTNDHDAPETTETPGNDVVYTITVTAPESNTTNVEDVKVTDLPPAGFEFVTGSDVASQGSLTSTYASPGVWSLGTMTPGQVITLSYRTTISGSQDAGNYEDLAFAQGKSVVGDLVLANASESTPFVGTDVEVVLPTPPVNVTLTNIVERRVDTKTIHKTKRVLGAATVLPSTGANINTILSALLLLLGGLILLLLGKQSTWNLIKSLNKSMTKIFIFAVVAGVLFAGNSANAASGDLKVNIEQPKAVINDPEIKVGFVVLDISADDTIDVSCQVSDDGGTTWNPFDVGAHNNLIAGGTSGDCDVDAADMPANGTYIFRVIATEDTTGDTDTATADPIELISGTPSTPLNYSRAAGSCTASFTTANDGLTDKVELYRSLSSTFTADGSTFVDDVTIAPNTSGTITDTNGDCGGSYFYAIRAVAASGLTSGFVGDESVVIDNERKTKTKTTIKKVAGPTIISGAIPVTSGEVPSGAVEGATTGEEIQPSAEPEKEGAVLGSATEAAGAAAEGLIDWIRNHPWWSAFWLLIIILIAYFARRMYLGKYNAND
jgi:hypothetical protein